MDKNSLFVLMEHADWGDDILRDQQGKVVNPMAMNAYLAVILGVLCCVGFPLNFTVFNQIVNDKKMRERPRYILELAIVFSGIFTLCMNVVQIVHYLLSLQFGASEWLCHFYVVVFMGLPYVTLLFNCFLSLIDCFTAITFPLWHRHKVTARAVVYWLIGLNLVVALAVKWAFISATIPVRCAFQPSHGLTIRWTESVLIAVSVVVLVLDFFKTWQLLPRAARAVPVVTLRPPPPEEPQQQQELIELVVFNPQVATALPPPASDDDITIDIPDTTSSNQQQHQQENAGSSNNLSIHSSPTNLRKMELKAIRMFLVSVIPLVLLPLPFIASVFYYYNNCRNFTPDDVCTTLNWIIPYLFLVLMGLHALVNPIINLRFNKDFQSPSPLHTRRRRNNR